MHFKLLVLASCLAMASAQWWTTIAPDPGCPPPSSITPCLCEYNSFDEIHSFYCRDSITSSRLSEIFNSVDFPVITMTSFTAEYCTLTSLPAGVFGSMKFESINVNVCELSSIDPSVLEGQASTLKSLNLDHNSLSSFPFSVELPNLESMHIADNQLTALPALNYPQLKFFDADLNSISQLDATLLVGTPNLERLYLPSNKISSLPAGFTKATPNLEELTLHHNSLTSIPAGTFDFSGDSRAVIDVDLHNNAIGNVEVGAFLFPTGSCPQVFLDFNALTSLDSGAFEPIVSPMAANDCPGLFIAGNNIKCDCSLSWLAENAQYRSAVVDGYTVMCNGTPLPNWTTDSIGC